MYSMRYGTLPIVRATGGLDDTVINYDPENLEHSTGFKFWDLNSDAIHNTIRWAVHTYEKNKDAIYKMRQNGMKIDHSWDHTASEYEELYRDAHK
jgi:starch synthase